MVTDNTKFNRSGTIRNMRQTGFTLVELMLAMVFVSGLLLAIALLTIQVLNIYTKGVTIAAVDSAGQVITKELRDAVNSAAPGNVKAVSTSTAGRLCVDGTSYIWNTGDTLNNATATANKYRSGTDPRNIRFAKVLDSGQTLCTAGNLTPDIDRSKSTELLSAVDRNLAIRSLAITSTNPTPSGQVIYTFRLTLGTNDINQTSTFGGQTECKPPADAPNGDEFCAINSFEFTARAGNKVMAGSSNP